MGNEIKRDILSGQAEDIRIEGLRLNSDIRNYSTGQRTGSPPGREEDGDPGAPTSSITWVANEKILDIGIDYLSLTLYCSLDAVQGLYSQFFEDTLGELELAIGSRFYEIQFKAGGGFYLQAEARTKTVREHARMIFPGEACGYIYFDKYRQLKHEAEKRGIEIRCTRLDIRIDNCPFTPLQMAEDIKAGKAKTRADLSTIKIFEQPLERDDLGNMGTQGFYLGSRTSDRYLRIYDQHGFTRFELECKEDYANAYFNTLLILEDKFQDLIMGYAMDFIEMDADYWREFTQGYKRMKYSPTIYKDKTVERFRQFLIQQCAIIFSIIYDIEGQKIINDLLLRGRGARKGNSKYSAICHKYGLE